MYNQNSDLDFSKMLSQFTLPNIRHDDTGSRIEKLENQIEKLENQIESQDSNFESIKKLEQLKKELNNLYF